MNRSIVKTRNELQRITLKINQLKTKYTADNFNPISSPILPQSSPTRQYRDTHTHAYPISTQANSKKYSIPKSNTTVSYIGSNTSNINTGTNNNMNMNMNSFNIVPKPVSVDLGNQYYGNAHDEMYQKEFKVFRNQIYNYVEKCVVLSKQREEEMLARLKEDLGGSRINRKPIQERIKKIQQQTTNCLSNVQDVIILIKKNEKNFNDKLTSLQQKQRLQSQPQPSTPQPCKLAQTTNLTVQSLQNELQSLIGSSDSQMKKISTLSETIQEIQIKQQNIETRINKKISEQSLYLEEFCLLKFNLMQDQIQKYAKFNCNIERQVVGLREEVDKKLGDVEGRLGNVVEKMEKMEKGKNRVGDEKIGEIEERMGEFEDKIKQIEGKVEDVKENYQLETKNVERRIEKVKKSITEQLEQKLTLISQQLANSYTCPFEQLKTQLSQIQQTIQKNCQDISSIGQQTLTLSTQLETIIKNIHETSSSHIQTSTLLNQIQQYLNTITKTLETTTNSTHTIYTYLEDQTNKIESMQKIMGEIDFGRWRVTAGSGSKRGSGCKEESVGQSERGRDQREARDARENVGEFFDLEEVQMNLRVGIVGDLTKGILGDVSELRSRVGRVQKQVEDMSNQINISIDNSISLKLSQTQISLQKNLQQPYPQIPQPLPQTSHELPIINTNTNKQQKDEQKQIMEIMDKKFQSLHTKMQAELLNLCTSHNSSLESNLKNMLYQELEKIQSKLEERNRHLNRIETLDSFQENSQRNKTSPIAEEDEGRKGLEVVDEKLNQFENDINQTIKLLYEDIQNKVNQMLSHTGIMQFRSQFETTRRQLLTLQSAITPLLHPSPTSSPTTPPSCSHQLTQLKQQLLSQIANQVNRISSLMEQTIEEIQLKIQKLDNHFSYLYERMSKIQYDNANFKDKLTYLLEKGSPVKVLPGPEMRVEVVHRSRDSVVLEGFRHEVKQEVRQEYKQEVKQEGLDSKEQTNLLSMLGQFGASQHFFDC